MVFPHCERRRWRPFHGPRTRALGRQRGTPLAWKASPHHRHQLVRRAPLCWRFLLSLGQAATEAARA